MTIGQRIAQKRKELALSQEALGETLGVSRQSIYKWESDSALPEIDKLIALSRLFGVSVGWLLGVEDAQAESAAPEDTGPEEHGELTEAQLKMVEEIVEQYLAAQPKTKPRRRWPWVLVGIVLFFTLFNLYEQMDVMRMQNESIHNNISRVESSVYNQINGISNRVEEILKAQNDLTAEYGTEISSADLAQNTVTFSLQAVPKTFTEGMTAVFLADNGNGPVEFPAVPSSGQAFTCEAVTGLTDSISLSVVFIASDGTRQTQLLDTYEGLFSASLPYLTIRDYSLFGEETPNGTLTLKDTFVTTRNEPAKSFEGCPAAEIAEVRLGVFRNRKLLGWAEPCEQPENYHGDYTGEQFYRLPDLTIEQLTEEDTLYIAALVTDSYGRQFMACDVPYVVRFDTDSAPYLTYPSDGRYDPDPNSWTFN